MAPRDKAQPADLNPADDAVARMSKVLDLLSPDESTIGLAVSGGPDSLALLLLAAAARPGRVEAASVDHGLREDSRKEAEMVADLCARLGVPHEILTIEWKKKPASGIQERARKKRYSALGDWAKRRGIAAVATAHHEEDQAETLLMRLVRGAGVRGLAGMRARRQVAGTGLAILRPLLRWRRQELADICAKAGIEPASDPSNDDPQFERVRVRKTLGDVDWLDAAGLAKSAGYLSQADQALRWAAKQEYDRRVSEDNQVITFDPAGLPDELRRRIVKTIVDRLKTEGKAEPLRGRELNHLINVLANGEQATLRGVLCGGGPSWRFARAPARKAGPAAKR